LKDAARYVGLGTKALRQFINRGKLPYIQISPGAPFLVDRGDLDKFMEAHKINGQA
jgi:excisionase family DNA binding protein